MNVFICYSKLLVIWKTKSKGLASDKASCYDSVYVLIILNFGWFTK